MRSTVGTKPISLDSPLTDKAVQAATRIDVLISGTVSASWAQLKPYTKRLNINDAAPGMPLSMGVGSPISVPLAGLLMAMVIDHPITAIAGFALIDPDAADGVTILFSTEGHQTIMPPHLALASITTLGYAGSLLGPTLSGFIAQNSSLSLALGVIVMLLLAVCASSRTIIRSSGD